MNPARLAVCLFMKRTRAASYRPTILQREQRERWLNSAGHDLSCWTDTRSSDRCWAVQSRR
jgi:hypothetical protein